MTAFQHLWPSELSSQIIHGDVLKQLKNSTSLGGSSPACLWASWFLSSRWAAVPLTPAAPSSGSSVHWHVVVLCVTALPHRKRSCSPGLLVIYWAPGAAQMTQRLESGPPASAAPQHREIKVKDLYRAYLKLHESNNKIAY